MTTIPIEQVTDASEVTDIPSLEGAVALADTVFYVHNSVAPALADRFRNITGTALVTLLGVAPASNQNNWTGQQIRVGSFDGTTFDITTYAEREAVLAAPAVLTASGTIASPELTEITAKKLTAQYDRSASLHAISLNPGQFLNEAAFSLPANRYVTIIFEARYDDTTQTLVYLGSWGRD